MSCKEECFKNPKHPDNNCCFNCGRDVSLCDLIHVCGIDCCYWIPKADERRILIDIPADGNYIEILGHRIDGFESFEAFLEHLKKYAVLEETVKAQKAEIERLQKLDKLAERSIGASTAVINELRSEIAILTDANTNLQDLYQTEKSKVSKKQEKLIMAYRKLQIARAEAVKEFAERYERYLLSQLTTAPLDKKEWINFCLDELDNLKKEMAGES